MGKVTVYQCDYCDSKYELPSQVMTICGHILDGDGAVIYHGSKEKFICHKCVSFKIPSGDFSDETNDNLNDLSDFENSNEEHMVFDNEKEYIFLKRISDEKEENEFINVIGHVTRESFNDVYNSSLISCYYPINPEDEETPDTDSFNDIKKVSIVYKVFASIPQVKELEVILSDDDGDFAIIEKNVLDE